MFRRQDLRAISQNHFITPRNRSKTLCIQFSLLFGISYRLNFSVPCRRFILALNGIPIFYHFIPFFDICDFSVRDRLKVSASFFGFCIRWVCAYVKLLQVLGVCVGCKLLQTNVKKYHGKGCVSYPICCSHRGYVGTLNCCNKKYRPSLLNGISIIIYHFQVGILYTPI